MRFFVIRKADAKTEAGAMPSRELLAAMGKYMEEMVKAGVMLGGDGVQPSSKGARVKFSHGVPTVIDGPFTETKELLAGYCILQAKSREEAIEWLKKWPPIDGDGEIELEIRQILEADDFGPEFTPELREAEDKLRDKLPAKMGRRK